MKAWHTLVAGDSGSGKTSLLRETHDRYPGRTGGVSVWINHNGERVPGETVRSFDGLVAAVRDGVDTIDYRTDQATGVTHARSLGYHELDHPLQIITDEAQNVLPDGEPQAELGMGLHEDRDEAIKHVLCSQSPQSLAYTPLKQCKYFTWVGQPAAFHEGFFRYFGIDAEQLPDERFKYHVLDKQFQIVATGRTSEKYS